LSLISALKVTLKYS